MTDVAVVIHTPREKEQAIDAYLRFGAEAASAQFDVTVATLVKWIKEADLVGMRVQLLRETAELRRAVLADELIGDAQRLREQMFAKTTVIHWDEGELRQETIDQPTFADKAKIVGSIGDLVDSIIKLSGGAVSQTVVPVQVNIIRQGQQEEWRAEVEPS